ncbi:MAG: hypothetical protein ABWX92_14980, partial [Mycetocola sp.]
FGSGGAFVMPGDYPPPMLDKDGIDRDANGYAYRDGITSRVASEQKVLNESWPFRDSKGRHARGIDDRPAKDQRLVTVRLVLKSDGEVFLPGRATRWTDLPADRAHVFVVVDDPRVRRGMVCVRFRDVRPR